MSERSLLGTPPMGPDRRGRYRPANAYQNLEAARQVIDQKMRRRADQFGGDTEFWGCSGYPDHFHNTEKF